MKKIKKLLVDNGLTISVAESLTSGMIQSKMAKLSGSSSFFNGGITVYNITQKVIHLGIDNREAEKCNCVSINIAKQMAKGVKREFYSNIGISTTGYAEIDLINDVGVPYAHFAFAFCDYVESGTIYGTADMSRTKMRTHVTNEVIKKLPLFINNILNNKNTTLKENVDSGLIILKPNITVVELKGKVLNDEAVFIRHDKTQGCYVFCDKYGELMLFDSLDDERIAFKREGEIDDSFIKEHITSKTLKEVREDQDWCKKEKEA